jgi:hypothetical protein
MIADTISEPGFLTIDQAVAQLDAADQKPDEQASPAPEPSQAAPAADAPETELPADTAAEGDEAETPDAEKPEVEPEAETLKLEPPLWWSTKAKDRFRELSPELQAVVFEQEEVRERVVSKTKQESADARKTADAEREQLKQRISALDAILPQAVQTYRDRWANVDWPALAQQMDPAEYNRARAMYEQETRQVQTLAEESQRANSERLQAFDKEQSEKLKTVAPDLVDEKLGPQRRQELGKFLKDVLGDEFDPAQLRTVTARQLAIAYDAKRWRDAQAKAREQAANPQPVTKPAAPAPRPTVRATAAPAQGHPKNARLEALSRKRSLTIDEAVERMDLMQGLSP